MRLALAWIPILFVAACEGSPDPDDPAKHSGETNPPVITHSDTDPGDTDDTLPTDRTDPSDAPDTDRFSFETGHTDGTDDSDAQDDTDTDGSGDTDGTSHTDASGDTDTDGVSGTDTQDDTDTDGSHDTDATWSHDTGWWWDTAVFQPNQATCDPGDLSLGWVFGGTPGEDWVIAAYPDADPGPGTADYTGAIDTFAKTFDGAVGTDVEVPNLRWMDNGFVVLAMADGYVIDVQDGNEDRNTSCSGDPNSVVIRHDNGFVSIYSHMKKNSLRVRRGDRVSSGDVLAVVGSSGCSTHPHVHTELRDCSGNPVDPFSEGMFANEPAYDTPLTLMDTHILSAPIDTLELLADPPDDATMLLANKTFGIGLTASGGGPGDRITVEIRRPDGVLYDEIAVTLTRELQRHHWWWNRKLGDWRGTWSIVMRMNGTEVANREIFVSAQVLAIAVAEDNLADVLSTHASLDLIPVWLDAYVVGGEWFYNLISEPGTETREIWYGVELGNHEALIADAAQRGLQPVHVDAASDGVTTRYVGIVANQSAQVTDYADASNDDHWDDYVALQNADQRPSVLVAVGDNFEPRWTALWDDRDVGSYITLVDVPRTDFFSMHQTQRSAGRYLSTLDVRVVNGEPYLVGVWDERERGRWSLKTILELPSFETTHNDNRMDGIRLRAISGYERFGGHRFAAWWTEI